MDDLDERLAQARSTVEGARALALVGRDGLVVVQALAGDDAQADLPRLAAEATDLLTVAERTLDEPRRGGWGRSVRACGAGGTVVAHPLDDELFSLWWLTPDADADAAERVTETEGPAWLGALR